MSLFRRRLGRHAAGRPDVAPARLTPTRPFSPLHPLTPPAATPTSAQGPRPQPQPPRPLPPPTGPMVPYGQVRLGFTDGSAVTLAPDDPRGRAFRALARELGRRG